MLAAKTALYILGGMLLIPGLFQFYNASQMPDSIFTPMIVPKMVEYGMLLTISGCILLAIGYSIKPKNINPMRFEDNSSHPVSHTSSPTFTKNETRENSGTALQDWLKENPGKSINDYFSKLKK